MLTELKPCPFCGGKASVSTYQTESLWSHDQVTYTKVSCDECDIAFQTEPDYEIQAIAAWNRRADARQAPTDYSNLLSVITDIRERSGVGSKPMLSELADAIAERIAEPKVGDEIQFCPQCGWNSAMDATPEPLPAGAVTDGLVAAVQNLLAHWDRHDGPEKRGEYAGVGYWSPAGRMVDTQFIADLRAAFAARPAAEPVARGVPPPDGNDRRTGALSRALLDGGGRASALSSQVAPESAPLPAQPTVRLRVWARTSSSSAPSGGTRAKARSSTG